MTRTLRHRLSFLVRIGLIGVAILLLARVVAAGKVPAAKTTTPPTSANYVVVPAQNIPGNIKRDPGKYVIEEATEKLLAAASLAPEFVNPKVQPGKVRWHSDFAAACRAAQKSGKPVLLFQMMGKLDDRFC
jgi:hypothetical protein